MNEAGSVPTDDKIPLELQRRPDKEYIQEIGARMEQEKQTEEAKSLILGLGVLLILVVCGVVWIRRVRKRGKR
jgi:hypothetical protein